MGQAEFLNLLRQHRRRIPRQALRTLRGQALAGDVMGAERGLKQVLRKLSKTGRHGA